MKKIIILILLFFSLYYINLKIYSCENSTNNECIIKYYNSLGYDSEYYFFDEREDGSIWVGYSDYTMPMRKVLKYAKENQFSW